MDMALLQEEIDSIGISMTKLAERSGVERSTLYYRMEHPETWRVLEMQGISKALKLTKSKQVEIFGLK